MVSHEEEPGGEVLEPPDESSAVEAQWNREGVEEAATTDSAAASYIMVPATPPGHFPVKFKRVPAP
jgi:hypothetical protein